MPHGASIYVSVKPPPNKGVYRLCVVLKEEIGVIAYKGPMCKLEKKVCKHSG